MKKRKRIDVKFDGKFYFEKLDYDYKRRIISKWVRANR